MAVNRGALRRLMGVVLILLVVVYVWAARRARHADSPERPVIEKVHDGDTVSVRGFGRCRILGIDTPEIWRQDGDSWVPVEHPADNAYAAKEWLDGFIGQPVDVETHGKDRYDRWLVRLTLPGGIDAAAYIREHGWEKKKK